MPSVKTIKNAANKILSADFLTHFGALLLIGVCVVSFMTTGMMLTSFIGEIAGDIVYGISVYLLIFFTLAMTVPLIYGYAVFEANCVKNGKADFSDVFCCFSCTELYFRSFRLFYALIWRFAVVFAVPFWLVNEFILYTNSERTDRISIGGYDLTYTFFAVLIIISLTASALVFSRFILSVYITVTRTDKSVSQCFFAARIHLKKCGLRLFNLAISFVPLIMLCIFSLGIAFVYVIPFMLTSFFVFAHERYGNTVLSEQIADMIFN